MDWRLATAAALLAFNGLGFGIPCVIGIRSLAAGEGIATVMGFPTYGHGPLERAGYPSTVPLLVAFLVVCILEVVAAAFVLMGLRAGAVLAFALLVPGAFFWWAFALPIPPVLALARSALLVAAWEGFA